MKIAFLIEHTISISNCQALIKKFTEKHEVKVFSPKVVDSKYFTKEDWCNFELDKFEDFEPDRVIVFNGLGVNQKACFDYIRSHYKTFSVELGWFPQRDNLYIDTMIHHFGNIAKELSQDFDNEDLDNDFIRRFYKTEKLNTEENSVFLPLQLEGDTSILYGSDSFKKMQSLVSFVSRELPNHTIYIKQHPKFKIPIQLYKNTKMVDCDTYSLIDNVKAVVGINSTVLIEARVFKKPTFQFGRNIIQTTPDNDLQEFMKNPRPRKGDQKRLNILFKKQFNKHIIPNWVVDYVENHLS